MEKHKITILNLISYSYISGNKQTTRVYKKDWEMGRRINSVTEDIFLIRGKVYISFIVFQKQMKS